MISAWLGEQKVLTTYRDKSLLELSRTAKTQRRKQRQQMAYGELKKD
jgi:hypothetical protein